jgi:predicted MPP superfamily phosphohydrolase
VNRRVFLYGLPTAALSAFGYARFMEPHWLEDTQKTVVTGRKLRRPLRIAHIADFHASGLIRISFLVEAFRRVLAMKPDLVCITGDFVTTDNDFDKPKYEAALQMLSSKVPTYAVMGNHDGGVWAAQSGWFANHLYVQEMVTRGGVQVLHNDAAKLEVDGMPLWLVGVGDWWSEELRARSAFENVSDDGAPVIVMNHNPDGKEDCSPFRWDLMLCGHTHGGQVIIPFYGPPIVPVIDRRYAVGLNAYQNRWIHTTRGVGNIVGVRVNCRPELSLLLVS